MRYVVHCCALGGGWLGFLRFSLLFVFFTYKESKSQRPDDSCDHDPVVIVEFSKTIQNDFVNHIGEVESLFHRLGIRDGQTKEPKEKLYHLKSEQYFVNNCRINLVI